MRVLSDPAAIAKYLSDESNAFIAPAELVTSVSLPENIDDLQAILKKANSEKVCCTISGAGTGVTGSRVPLCGGQVISMERMLRIEPPKGWSRIEHQDPLGDVTLAVRRGSMRAKVPPGIAIETLSRILLDNGLLYPPDPTESSAFLGSTLATNSSGARTFCYGPTRDWVTGLTVVLACGDILRVNRGDTAADDKGRLNFQTEQGKKFQVHVPAYSMPRTKNAAGLYGAPGMDLIDLFIGSEGTLGVFAEVEIKVEPDPVECVADVAFFGAESDALSYADEIRCAKKRGIVAIEYFDANSLAFIREKEPRVKQNYKAAVLVEALGKDENTVTRIVEACEKYEVIDDWSGRPGQFTEFRHLLPESINSYLKQMGSHKLGTDFAVPPASFPSMMKAYREADETFRKQFPRAGFHSVLFGHLGDYHLHFNFIAQTREEMAFAKQLYVALAKKAISLAGTISAEHGVGKKTVEVDGREVPYLELMYGTEGLDQIAAIKRALDPNLILNLGNMVPEGYF